MNTYNYESAVKSDIREWLAEHGIKTISGLDAHGGRDWAYDEMFVSDSVTGNASGSYTFRTWQAEENVCHNFGILAEAMAEFGCDDVNPIEKGAEWCDVTIRCHLLGQCLDSVVDEMAE